MIEQNECVEIDEQRAAGDVIDGEAIIINLVSGAYYSMLGIGGEIWSMVNARYSVAAMREHIVATHDVTEEEAARDLDGILQQLLDEGLVRVSSDAAVAPPIPAGETKRPYKAPRLQVFRDMEELLALDPPAPGMNQITWSASKSGAK